ncbi:N-acetyltransferase B complex non catalytic subunit-domain-containing protein [Limtongia smithiae]|uniref:N-acetyltransferase B complex non catalytic subunit-domain-containing protein n=1 Tax=Limtongia smithiae TaxID=1125753 RepID=UPI0034CF9B01
MYETAAKKRPKDEDLILSWFWATATGLDVRSQQRAAMALHKEFARRPYTLWCVASCYLLASSPAATAQEKMIFASLAKRFMVQVEPLATAEEAVLKARVLKLVAEASSATNEDLLIFLMADETAKWNNLELAVMRLESAVASGDASTVYSVAVHTLVDENKDDYESWKRAAEAVVKLADDAKTTAFEALLTKKMDTRNGALAKLFYASVKDRTLIFDAAKAYFDRFGAKQCAYEDLQDFVQLLDADAWLKYLDSKTESIDRKRATPADVVTLVNSQKFYYVMRPESPNFVLEAVQLYNDLLHTVISKATTDYYIGDDLLVLAAQWMMSGRKSTTTVASSDLILAVIVLLEAAASRDTHQFYIRMWLVRLYLNLGCFQQAFGHYSILSIKNIQLDVLSHHLLVRCASLFPTWKPLIATRDIYDMNATQTPKFVRAAYENGAFSQIHGIAEFAARLTHSVGKGILCVEAKRTARLLDMRMEEVKFSPSLRKTAWRDNRNFSVLKVENDLAGGDPLESKFRIGPVQRTKWTNAFILREAILDSIASKHERTTYVSELTSLLEAGIDEETTAAERWLLATVLALADLASTVSLTTTQTAFARLQELLEDGFKKFTTPTSSPEQIVTWEWFHNRFTVFETAKTVVTSLDLLFGGKGGKIAALSAGMKKILLIALDATKEDAKKLKLGRDKWAREASTLIESYDFIKSLDTSTINIESLMEGIGKSQDDALTLLRAVKL